MNPESALKIRQAGNALPAVAALYEAWMAVPDWRGTPRVADESYGPHARHRLDLYCPEDSDVTHPVVVFFHGGGFIRGSKEHRMNLGCFLARQGFVAVLANYRLAPESRWPCGPQDVVRVWQWLQDNAARCGADPRRIVLMGESAGAAHVAAACLRTEFQPEGWRIAGAALLSGTYNPGLESLAPRQLGIAAPDVRNEAYFGEDHATWAEASTVDHVNAPPFPLLISVTELDLAQMQVGAGELFARLVTEHVFRPELLTLPFHNHFSQGYSFGTDDVSLSEPVLAFLRSTTGSPAPAEQSSAAPRQTSP